MSERSARYRKGLLAEWLALVFLLLKGYWPLGWRVRTPVGEIDLVVRRRSTLVFVEVKARRTRADALAAVTPRNQQRVARAAQYVIAGDPQLASYTCRFDVVAIAWYIWPRHVTHAFF
jgi:putative endonuclease